MRASAVNRLDKRTRHIYCTEKEKAYLQSCLKKYRDNEIDNADSALNGSLDKLDQILNYISDLKSEVYTLRTYTVSELERKINALTHKVEQLSGQSY